MMKHMMLCAEANKIELVEYLSDLGFSPQRVRGDDWWYCSPLRQERTGSFKVARSLNVWYDHGIGKGGSLVDFGVLFHRCTVKEFLQKLSDKSSRHFSPPPHIYSPGGTPRNEEKKLLITSVSGITSDRFCTYLQQRQIDLALAKQFVDEVSYVLHGSEFRALGFRNNSGGYELRNEYFKGSSSPKDVTLLGHDCENLSVFEGFFSFLSYLCFVHRGKPQKGERLKEGQTSFLILNSLAFFEKSRPLMERYASVYLYLDRDAAGLKATAKALRWTRQYKDNSSFYHGHKDLNDFLIIQQKVGHQPALKGVRHR